MAAGRLKIWGVIAVLALSIDTGWALQRQGPPGSRARNEQQQERKRERKAGPRGGQMHGPGPHVGDWLRRNRNLSQEEQERALQRDSHFQRLNPERQERLRERLRKFNELPEEQQQRILHRIETFEHLTPEQQARAHMVHRNFRRLPDERQRAVREAFSDLKDKGPEERQQAIDSDAYRNRFSERELDIMRGMTGLAGKDSPN